MYKQNWRCLLPNIKFIILGVLCGAVIGGVIYTFILSNVTAVAVVQTGRIGEHDAYGNNSGVQLLAEQVQRFETAEAIATKLGEPKLSQQLAGRHYGGEGKLRARLITDGELIEIRVTLRDQDLAISAAETAAQIAVDQDLKMFTNLRSIYERRLVQLSKESDSANQLQLGLLTKNTLESKSSMADVLEKLIKINDESTRLMVTMSEPNMREPSIFSHAKLTRPVVSGLWSAVLLAALAGGAVGYALGLGRQK